LIDFPYSKITILFLRAPEKGKVKTRLAVSLDKTLVLELYKNFVADVIDAATKVSNIALYCWPPEKKGAVLKWFEYKHPVFCQNGTDLGEKMANSFMEVFESGYKKAVIVGTDIPDITAKIINDAYDKLSTYDTVIGPSEDGGYYLIGFRKDTFFKNCFKGIKWSTDSVFKETIAILEKKHMNSYILPTLNDIDTMDDLIDLCNRCKKGFRTGGKTEDNLKRIKMINNVRLESCVGEV